MSNPPTHPTHGLAAAAPAAALLAVLVDLLIAMAQSFTQAGPLGRLLAAYLERTAHQLASPPAPLPPRQASPRAAVPERAPKPLSWRARFRRWKARLNPLANLRPRRTRAPIATSRPHRAPRIWSTAQPARRLGIAQKPLIFSKPDQAA